MHPQLMALVDGIPLSGPSTVACSLKSRQGAQILDAHHDGYLERFGVLHHRELILSADGKSFAGVDRLAAPDGDMRLKQDVPFAIHFHLHPSVEILPGKELNTVRLTLSDESTWLFRCDGAAVGVEESLFFADSSAPMETLQITIRGATFGESVVRWSIERE